jgi:dimethylamine monooxygenase subunit A
VDFDFSHIKTPFRMQPGLRRIAPEQARLTPLDAASALYAEKLAVVTAGASRHKVAGFNPALALEAIAVRASASGIDAVPGREIPLELTVEEDFALLDGATGTLPWLCVCTPSHWAPEDKCGLDFAALHGPVADNVALIAASRQLVQLVTAGECWERHVWTVSPSRRYDQHPRRHARQPWPVTSDPGEFAGQCWFRAERQTFFPVGHGTRQAVFAIRVMLQPLPEAVQEPGRAKRLHDALASMSAAVVDYKNLGLAREPLLRWLGSRP